MKKNKLNLSELKVKSFIPSDEPLNLDTVKGGKPVSYYEPCSVVNCTVGCTNFIVCATDTPRFC